jgi:hypothetical protein
MYDISKLLNAGLQPLITLEASTFLIIHPAIGPSVATSNTIQASYEYAAIPPYIILVLLVSANSL